MMFDQMKSKLLKTSVLNKAILSPLSEEQPWTSVEVITLKQSIIDKATDYVLSNVHVITDVKAQVTNELQTAEYKIGREFVDITDDNITIAMDCDLVDDTIIDQAITRLMNMDRIRPGLTFFGAERIMDFSCKDSVNVV